MRAVERLDAVGVPADGDRVRNVHRQGRFAGAHLPAPAGEVDPVGTAPFDGQGGVAELDVVGHVLPAARPAGAEAQFGPPLVKGPAEGRAAQRPARRGPAPAVRLPRR